MLPLIRSKIPHYLLQIQCKDTAVWSVERLDIDGRLSTSWSQISIATANVFMELGPMIVCPLAAGHFGQDQRHDANLCSLQGCC